MKNYKPLTNQEESIAKQIVDSAYTVHKELGPGLLEKIYETCLCYELENRGLNIKKQVVIPVKYKELEFEEGYRLDILVEDKIICELKACENHNSVWEAQLLSYLKLTGKRLGFLINFSVNNIGDGIKRIIL
jgi:GxxExxY protein